MWNLTVSINLKYIDSGKVFWRLLYSYWRWELMLSEFIISLKSSSVASSPIKLLKFKNLYVSKKRANATAYNGQ